MKVDVKTPDGRLMDEQAATTAIGTALRIAPGFVATALDENSGIETTIDAYYSAEQGRYLVSSVLTRAATPGIELSRTTLNQLTIQQILQAATPHCIALTLDDIDDPHARWLTLAELTRTEGRIVPLWMVEEVTRRGWSPERLVVIQLLFGAAALSGQPPVKTIQVELGIPHRTASDWVKHARAGGHLAGMSYIVGRQADG